MYVGGHQRWLDNPAGGDSAGPGAVSRPGIGAIDPVTGMALPWNPTKSRHHGTMVLYPTPQGLWVGSDGERFGREDHYGIGFAPLDLSPTPDTTRPNTIITSGPSGSVTNTSATFSFSATEPATFQCRLDGAAFAPCSSPRSYTNLTAGPHTFQVVAVDSSYNVDATPAARSWTVVAARPDGRIRRSTGPLVGNDIYNATGAGQTSTGTAARSQSVTYYLTAQNDASVGERLRLRGQGSTAGFTVVYRNPAGADITNRGHQRDLHDTESGPQRHPPDQGGRHRAGHRPRRSLGGPHPHRHLRQPTHRQGHRQVHHPRPRLTPPGPLVHTPCASTSSLSGGRWRRTRRAGPLRVQAR